MYRTRYRKLRKAAIVFQKVLIFIILYAITYTCVQMTIILDSYCTFIIILDSIPDEPVYMYCMLALSYHSLCLIVTSPFLIHSPLLV